MPTGIAAVFTSVGVGAETAAVLGNVVLGSAVGTATSALTGGDIGFGALTGGLTGGALGFGGEIGSELGIGTTAGTALAGTAAGALSSAIYGKSIGQGALFGGVSGLAASALGAVDQVGSSTSPSGASPGATGGATGGGAPLSTGIAASGTPDAVANAALHGVQPESLISPSIESITVPSSAGLSTTPLSAGAGAGGVAAGAALNPGIGKLTELSGDQPSSTGAGLSAGLNAGIPSVTSTALPQAGGVQYGTQNLSTPTVGQAGVAGPGNVSPGGGGFFDHGVGKFASSPAGILGLGGLAYQAATQPKLPGQEALVGNLKNSADSLSNQGKLLSSYINTGQLPAGVMASVNNATSAAKATLRSRYAALGLSGSTSEATALSQVDEQAAGQVFEIANNLLQTGIKEVGLSDEIYRTILSQTNANDERMSGAIANFAAAIAGGGNQRGITLNVGGTA